MKQHIIKLLLLFVLISILPVSAGTFKVEDPVLEKIIREQLQIDEDNEITLDDISQLVEISNFIEIEGPNNTSTFKQVKSFKGLETAENIKIFNYMIFLDNPGLPVAIDNLNSWNLDTIFIKSNNGYERENKIFEEETVKLINEITNTAPLKLVEASYKTEDFSFLEGIDLNQRGIETLSLYWLGEARDDPINYKFDGYMDGEKIYKFTYYNPVTSVFSDENGKIQVDIDKEYEYTQFAGVHAYNQELINNGDFEKLRELGDMIESRVAIYDKNDNILPPHPESPTHLDWYYKPFEYFSFYLTESEMEIIEDFEITFYLTGDIDKNTKEPRRLDIGYAIHLARGLEIDVYDVHFNSNGGSQIPSIIRAEVGKTISKPETPTRDGYIFKGWYKSNEFIQPWNFDIDIVQEETTLYARWDKVVEDTYRVDFDSNGGSEVNSIVDILNGSSIEKPNEPIKDGYTFVGWFTSNTFDKEWNFKDDVVTEDITLYAKWDKVLEDLETTNPDEGETKQLPQAGVFNLSSIALTSLISGLYLLLKKD